jgi:3-oxoadipate enol-lactonase/4-carboxymuconolactone decarboxylase
MPFATRENVRLYWRFDGDPDRPVLLLLNSIGCDMSVWDRVVPYLLPQFRLLRMDTRGHGASDAPAGEYTLEMLAEDALCVMVAAGVKRAAVCGISLGGMVAAALVLRAPAQVSALVLACTSAQVDPALWQARIDAVRSGGMAAIAETAMQRFFADEFRRTHPELAGSFLTTLLAQNPDGYVGCCAAIRDMRLAGRLSPVSCPVLVIGGVKDVSLPFEGHGDRIQSEIASAEAVLLPAAHLACVEAPGGFAGAVRQFLAVDRDQRNEARRTLYESGLRKRREVLGDEWVDRAIAARTPFNADFQTFITTYAWEGIWNRPGLDHRTRRLIVLVITAALGRWEEFRLHLRAGLEQGDLALGELKEALMQTAIYAGVPAANTAFHEAGKIIDEFAAAR